jgi:integrase
MLLDTPEKREKLAPRGDPYTHRLAPYKFLTYRKLQHGGTWGARLQKPGEARGVYRIGDERDYDFATAQIAALEWCEKGGDTTAIEPGKLSVRLACSRYLTWRHNEKALEAYQSTKAAFDCHIFKHSIADKPVASLTTADYQAWLDGTAAKLIRNHRDPDPEEAKRKGRYNANLCWSFFKAALNHALLTSKKLPAEEWRAVKRLEGGDTVARQVFLSAAESQRLINVTSGAFRDLVSAALLTGARVGELKAAKVRDFNLAEGKWKPSHSKVMKKGRRMRFLDDQTVALLERLCAGKAPTDLVFMYRGHGWGNGYDRFWRAARDQAQLDPAATFYALRHTYISNQMKAGVPPQALAENCGTSVKQIEDHYGHFAEEEKRRLLAQGAMKLDIPEDDKVVRLR